MSLFGTLYDLYKVGKEWYLGAVNKHDISGIINDSHNAIHPIIESDKKEINKEKGKIHK